MKRTLCLFVAIIMTISAVPALAYEELAKGSKGEEVVKLQERLIELGYLTGTADGIYGGQTKGAVELFQMEETGLDITGIADEKTQKKLFSLSAPKATVYEKLDYKQLSRTPDKFMDSNYKFDGVVLQVMESDWYSNMILMEMRVATKGNYDDVVYLYETRFSWEDRILEGDRITVYAGFDGLETYRTVLGKEETIPSFWADRLIVK